MKVFVKFILITIILILRVSSQNENTCEASNEKCFKVVALIPARAGSKGIKNKNLATIRNETLLSRTIKVATEFGQFDSVWVSTDGENIAEETLKHGAKVYWRDPLTATDNASTASAVEDFLSKQKDFDAIAVLQCTSPFLQKQYLETALELIRDIVTDCVFSVTRSHQLRWSENADGFVSPLNFNTKKRPRRQDWKGELVENGMFYFVKIKSFFPDKVFQTYKCKVVEIPKESSLEIDTEVDLMLARATLSVIENINQGNN